MPHQEIPGWLIPAFARAARGAGAQASAGAIDNAGARLLDRWSAPERKYHNVRHLVDLLQHVDELQQETHNPHSVRLAAWYHGAVFNANADASYARHGGEDEVASAEYAREELTALEVPETIIDDVFTMVESLARHASNPASIDCAVLLDADLAILAADPQRYRTYMDDVREEYAHIPEHDFLTNRRTILHKLLKRDRLYVSPLGSGWEAQARQNVAGEITRIDRELEHLDAASA
jgi:predicted metal-dependent HD superfamily phosphohydrolase